MRIGWLEIELRSDMCPATGEGISGLIDTEIAHEYGLPVIPAKRIKGCLLEAAKELRDCNIVANKELEQLFGIPGADRSGLLHVHDAHIYRVFNIADSDLPTPIVVENYEELARSLKNQTEFTPTEILDEFTLLRTRTAIDDKSGGAAKTSLRTMRVLIKDTILRCKIEISTCPQEDKLEALLEKCVKGLRHIGLGKTRGFGEVRCRLGEMSTPTASLLEPLVIPNDIKEMEIRYELFLENPVIFPSQNGLYNTCEDWIPGNAILGALANMYIEDHQLGEFAHQDPQFARMFLREDVKFGYAFPKVEDRVFHPCPASWLRVKNEDIYYDLTYGKHQHDEQLRSEKQLVHRMGDVVCIHKPNKEVRMHHARPSDRGIGHALGEDSWGSRNEEKKLFYSGQFFQYVSLCAGQTFTGALRGSAGDLNALLECLHKRGNKLRLGRSRTAEYGNVVFSANHKQMDYVANQQRKKERSQLMLWLISPMVLRDSQSGRVTPNPRILIEEINKRFDCEAELKESFPKFTQLSGYNSKWRLPRQQLQALAGGSTFLIEVKKPICPEDIESTLWGKNTGEGCGQLKVTLLGDELKNPKILERRVQIPPRNTEELHDNILLTLLRKRKQSKPMINQNDLEVAIGNTQINSAKIHQIIELFELHHNYESVEEELGKIKDEKKKKQCLDFIKSCKDKGPAYMKTYLQNAKWHARRRDNDAMWRER